MHVPAPCTHGWPVFISENRLCVRKVDAHVLTVFDFRWPKEKLKTEFDSLPLVGFAGGLDTMQDFQENPITQKVHAELARAQHHPQAEPN